MEGDEIGRLTILERPCVGFFVSVHAVVFCLVVDVSSCSERLGETEGANSAHIYLDGHR